MLAILKSCNYLISTWKQHEHSTPESTARQDKTATKAASRMLSIYRLTLGKFFKSYSVVGRIHLLIFVTMKSSFSCWFTAQIIMSAFFLWWRISHVSSHNLRNRFPGSQVTLGSLKQWSRWCTLTYINSQGHILRRSQVLKNPHCSSRASYPDYLMYSEKRNT